MTDLTEHGIQKLNTRSCKVHVHVTAIGVNTKKEIHTLRW